MGAGLLTFSGTIAGLPTGQRTISVPYNISGAIDSSEFATLALGDNLFQIPAGATILIIEMPPGNTFQVLLKGSSGDSGFLLHPTLPTILTIGAAQTVFVLNTPNTLGGPVELTFI